MRFFVTGGAGFIGSELCRALVAASHDLVVYDDFSRGRRDWVPSSPGVRIVGGDVRDRQRVRDAIGEAAPGCVVHLSALHYIPDCIARPDETFAINVQGSRNVFDACVGSSVRSVLFASSAAVYAPSDTALREASSPIGPLEVYGESKVTGEKLAREFQAATGIDTTSLRLFNALGPRETNAHVVPHIFESLRRSHVVDLGNVSPQRDYIHTTDIARAIIDVAERARGYSVYNVGSGVARSVSDLIGLLDAKLNRVIKVRVDAARVRAVDRQVLLADISKIRNEIGWVPRISHDACVDELIDYYELRDAPRAEPQSSPGGVS